MKAIIIDRSDGEEKKELVTVDSRNILDFRGETFCTCKREGKFYMYHFESGEKIMSNTKSKAQLVDFAKCHMKEVPAPVWEEKFENVERINKMNTDKAKPKNKRTRPIQTATICCSDGNKTVTISSVFEYKGHKFFTHKDEKRWTISHYHSGYMMLNGMETRKQAIALCKQKMDAIEKRSPGNINNGLNKLPIINK